MQIILRSIEYMHAYINYTYLFPLPIVIGGLSITPVALHGGVQLLRGCRRVFPPATLAPPSLPTRLCAAPFAGVTLALCILPSNIKDDRIGPYDKYLVCA